MFYYFISQLAVAYDALFIHMYLLLGGDYWPWDVLNCSFLLTLPSNKNEFNLNVSRSPDQSSVSLLCLLVLFWLAISLCMALVHKLEQSIIIKASPTSLLCLGVWPHTPANLYFICHHFWCHAHTIDWIIYCSFVPPRTSNNGLISGFGRFTFVHWTVYLTVHRPFCTFLHHQLWSTL